jgi:hypothetical protein
VNRVTPAPQKIGRSQNQRVLHTRFTMKIHFDARRRPADRRVVDLAAYQIQPPARGPMPLILLVSLLISMVCIRLALELL